MKYYHAIFKKTSDTIKVEFPDLKGCVTFGKDWEEALDNATDVLAGWLAHAEAKFIVELTSHDNLKNKYPDDSIIPIAIDEKILESYEELKRFNVIFPAGLLNKVDEYRKKRGLKRSTLLRKATEEFLKKTEKVF